VANGLVMTPNGEPKPSLEPHIAIAGFLRVTLKGGTMNRILFLTGVLIALTNSAGPCRSALAQQGQHSAQEATRLRRSRDQSAKPNSGGDFTLAKAATNRDLNGQGNSDIPLEGTVLADWFLKPPTAIRQDVAKLGVPSHRGNATRSPAPVLNLAQSNGDPPYASPGTSGSASTLPPQGADIIENVLFTNNNAPSAPCSNVGQNAFGYIPPYNDVVFTDPQWGGVYQEMIRSVPGGASDHNFYYSRNSFNANGTLMLGLQTPSSPNGTAKPWTMVLFDGNGCFLKPLFVAAGAPSGTPSFNWRVNWSPTDPNVFYTTGVSGLWPNLGHLDTNTLYAIHPCAINITGAADATCSGINTMAVVPIYQFTRYNSTGSNIVSTNQPSGPSLSEDGSRIGIVTRPSEEPLADYYWSSVGLTNSTTVAPNSLHTFDITANYPAGYCYSKGAVEKSRYIGNRFLVEAGGYRGSGTPVCGANQTAAMQIIDDSTASPTQYGFIAQDQNAPWFNGGGHEAWSPYIVNAPGGGYFVYNHADGATNYALEGCTTVANVATCLTTGGILPAWPIGTKVVVSSSSVSGYDGKWPITAISSNSFSWNLGITPNPGTGGRVTDGNQWEIHSIGLDGTQDLTHFEAVNSVSGQTVHSFWPWGSPLNGGTVTNFFYAGFAYNSISQYPTLSLAGCSYTGTAPTGSATCTLASGNIPGNWIVPSNQQGSGTSTPYIYEVSDGTDQCYNGAFGIIAATANTFSYHPLCTPVGPGSGGEVYLGATDEIYKCYRDDSTYGNGCVPIARTYTDQVIGDFFYQPLPNGSAEGDKVEFDSAPAFLQ
jgi:hypothetical protein